MVLSTLRTSDPFFQTLALKQAFSGLLQDDKLVLEASKASLGLENKTNLDAARTLKKHIPKHGQSTDIKDRYYQSLIQRAGSLEISIDGATASKEEAITKMTLIFKTVEALYNLLDGYIGRAYQQKFDPEKFKPEFLKIEAAVETLQTLQQKSTKWAEELGKRFLEGDEFIQHLGQELMENQLQKYLEVSQNEKASQTRWDDLMRMLRENSHKIKDREQKKLEAEKKVKDLEAKISELRTLCQQRRAEIIQESNGLTVYEERREDLRSKANNAYVKSVNKTSKDKEQQFKKTKDSFNSRIDLIDEMMGDLTKKLGAYATMHTSYHYIFVLDHSGSMYGPRWEALVKALNLFVEKNKSQALDLLSVITFDDSPEEHMKKMKFSEYSPPVSSRWGGTNFDVAFTMARDFANLSRSHCPVVVFLTDGHGTMNNTMALLREMSAAHKQKGFMLFSIGVGDQFNTQKLQEITMTANDGNCFVDLGNDRIELLHTTKNENVLDKIFTDISAAVYGLPFKVKKALDTLKQEKEEVSKEAEQTVGFYNSLSEQELQDLDSKQQEILQRKLKSVEETEISHKERIQFLEKEVKEIEQEMTDLTNKIEHEIRSFTTTEIDTLKEEQAHLQAQKDAVYDEVKQFSEERKVALQDAQAKKTDMNVSTTLQLFDFYAAKDNFEDANANTKTNIDRFKNFIGFIIEESAAMKEGLKAADFTVTELLMEGALDIVFEFYKDLVELERGSDISNMKKIACKILRVDESDVERQKRLDLLFTCLHPRQLVDPNAREDEHHNKIKSEVNKNAEYEVELLGEELKRCRTEKLNAQSNINRCKTSVGRAQEDLETIERDIGKKEREVRTLKNKVKALEKDTDDKENKRRENTVSDDPDDDDLVEQLQKAQAALRSQEKKRDELEQTISESRAQKRSLEDKLDDVEMRIPEKEMKISESERETRKLIRQLEQDYSSLRNELIPKVAKKVNDFRIEQLETYKQNLANSLMQPLKSYLSNMRNPMGLKDKVPNPEMLALDS